MKNTENKKQITIGIPAFKAKGQIEQCIASIYIQTIVDKVSIIIATDFPSDDYNYLKNLYPTLDIKILPCTKNVGPGLARQKCLDNCETPWITFIDADDVFFTPFALEALYNNSKVNPNIIEVQGTFLQEITDEKAPMRTMPHNDAGHPWVFGRLYNTKFLKENGISFSELRAMEDGEFNWKIRMIIEGSENLINIIDDPIYLWKTGSEHSITRIGTNNEDKIPQYNFDLCAWGSTIASIRAIKFCKKKNPFNGNIIKFALEMMINQYFTYIECYSKKPIFAEQNFFNAKRFYNEIYKKIEEDISDEILQESYTIARMHNGENLINVIPIISFPDFMNKIKNEDYNGEKEFKEIRGRLPKEIIDNDIKTGVATF